MTVRAVKGRLVLWSAMDLSRLLLLSALLTHASASPIAAGGLKKDIPSPLSPASHVIWSSKPHAPPPQATQTGDPGILSSITPNGLVHDVSRKPSPTRTSIRDDEAMKPILNRRDVHERSDFSLVTLAPDLPLSDRISLFPIEPGCTTTLPRTTPRCWHWDGTETIYPSTVIQRTSINCNGCSFVQDNFYNCPNRQVSAFKRVSTPSTYWNTVCATSPVRVQTIEAAATATGGARVEQGLAPAPSPAITTAPTPTAALEARQGLFPVVCPTTFMVQPEKSAGKTFTTYSRFTTTTVYLNCGGCPLVISTALVGYGPPTGFTKTTTLPVGTKTTFACH